MKLNGKQSDRTVHMEEYQGGFLIIERVREEYAGKVKWEADKVWLSRDEITKLYEHTREVTE